MPHKAFTKQAKPGSAIGLDGILGRLEFLETEIQNFEGNVPAVLLLKPGNCIIGRAASADIVLKAQVDGKYIISREHAVLKCKSAAECSIQDLDSTNGVYLNNQRIQKATLKNGDIVRFAGASDAPMGSFAVTDKGSVSYKVYLQPPLTPPISSSKSNDNIELKSNKSASSTTNSKKRVRVSEDAKEGAKPSPSTANKRPKSEMSAFAGNVADELKALREQHDNELTEMRSRFKMLHEALSKASLPSSSGMLNHRSNIDLNDHPAITTTTYPNPKLSTEETYTRNHNGMKSNCKIDASSLTLLLTCALCQDILSLPVVLPCSHGYCWLCIEEYHQRGTGHSCPVCCDPPRKREYYRSDHLDSLVWLVLEASTNAEQQVRYCVPLAAL